MQGWIKCKCCRTFKDSIYRHVNVVFKEGMAPPAIWMDSYTFCDSECEICKGRGYIEEQATSEREVEALMSDFRKKMAVIG